MIKKLIDFKLLKLNFEIELLFKKQKKTKEKVFFDEVQPLNFPPSHVPPLRPPVVTPLLKMRSI